MTSDKEAKKRILKRVTEIIKDYLFDENESYAYISLYFEKSNGEYQHKRLVYGKPSEDTPDRYKDEKEDSFPWESLLQSSAKAEAEKPTP